MLKLKDRAPIVGFQATRDLVDRIELASSGYRLELVRDDRGEKLTGTRRLVG
jgi:hypothetical protein